jgi:predicted subunit of tRNA(5-methylaminomethyl-2-thiouridylate) methyltransferase
MNTVIIIGFIFIGITFFSIIIIAIDQIAAVGRYKRKRADYDLRTMMQEQKQENEEFYPERTGKRLSGERNAVFSVHEQDPVV